MQIILAFSGGSDEITGEKQPIK